MHSAERTRRLIAWGLVLPASIYLICALIVPIATYLYRVVDNRDVPETLPRTVQAIENWDGLGLPPDDVYAAMAEDLRSGQRQDVQVRLARRLNYNIVGFRSLIGKTVRRLPDSPDGSWKQTLIGIDGRWGEPAYWTVIRNERNSITAFYLLNAVDLKQGEAGRIEPVPEVEALFGELLLRTVVISSVVTLLCVVLAFPVARVMASSSPSMSNWILLLVLVPFWTSLLVRSAAWVILLQNEGLINQTLTWLGVVDQPLTLIYNRTGVYIAMTHVLLPFAILPMYSVMKGLSVDYTRAAAGLGASPVTVFVTIYLPQAMPGIVVGAALTFILALGYYITPQMVGGPGDQMISFFIAYYTNHSVNWGMGAALALLLLTVVVLLYAILSATIGLDRLKVR